MCPIFSRNVDVRAFGQSVRYADAFGFIRVCPGREASRHSSSALLFNFFSLTKFGEIMRELSLHELSGVGGADEPATSGPIDMGLPVVAGFVGAVSNGVGYTLGGQFVGT